MSSARRFRSGQASGTFRTWPFGKCKPERDDGWAIQGFV